MANDNHLFALAKKVADGSADAKETLVLLKILNGLAEFLLALVDKTAEEKLAHSKMF
jgi:hypothetical protein